jgi:hypothetical protein
VCRCHLASELRDDDGIGSAVRDWWWVRGGRVERVGKSQGLGR